MRLYAWGENTVCAGRVIHEDYIDAADLNDMEYYEGAPEQLREIADGMLAAAEAAGAGHDLWLRRVARGILEHVGGE